MNSLVVLFSVMALAAAKPGLYSSDFVSYAVPAAVSSQSRVDIKSSPAVITTETVAPVARALFTEPAIIAPPAAYAAPITYTAPITYAAPTAYAAPFAVAPAAVSSQSHFEVKSSPAVISNVAAAPVVNTFGAAPIAYSAPFAATYSPSLYAPAIAPAVRVVKSAAVEPAASDSNEDLPVPPTETPEVVAARAAHLEAKAIEEHKIQKRSVSIVAASPVISSYAATPVISNYAAPFVYTSPLARYGTPVVSAPILTGAYGVHPY